MHSLLVALLLAVLGCCSVSGAETGGPLRIPLWSGPVPDGKGGTDTNGKPVITVHRPEKPNGTAVVICPGGGYGGLVTGAEGHGIAQWLNRHGIVGVVLEYRLPAGRAGVPLMDAQRAIRLTRHHAKDWGVRVDRVGIMGFSAGGHLAATTATLFDGGEAGSPDPVERLSGRPDLAILVYPVITMGPEGHGGSRQNLLGKDAGTALLERYSCERQVTEKTPPMFIAHAVDDRVVGIANARMMAGALKAKGVSHRLVELPDGDHGLNGYKGPSWDRWQREALEWMGTVTGR